MKICIIFHTVLTATVYASSTKIEISSTPVTLPDPESLLNNISCAIFDVYKSSIVAVHKYCSDVSGAASGKYKIEEDEINRGTLDKLAEVRTNVNAVFNNFNSTLTKLSNTINEAANLGQVELQPAKKVWNELKYGVRRLKRNIRLIRVNMNKTLVEIKEHFKEGSQQFTEAMDNLYSEVLSKLCFELRSATNMFQDALSLPNSTYYDIQLEDVYKNWVQVLRLTKESPVSLFKSARSLFNQLYNAVQTKFFLSGILSENKLWPLSSLVWGDAVQVKRFVDNSMKRLARYIKACIAQILTDFGKDNSASQEAIQRLYNQALSEIKLLVDITEVPFKRLHSFNDQRVPFFTPPVLESTHKGRFEDLLKYLEATGYSVQLCLTECSNLVIKEMPLNAGISQTENYFDYTLNNAFKKSSQATVLPLYSKILQEERIQEVTDVYKYLFVLVQKCAETAHEDGYKLPKVISMKMHDDAYKYKMLMDDLRVYISKCACFIDDFCNQTNQEYKNVMGDLCADVGNKLDVAADYTFNFIQRINNYLEKHQSCLVKFGSKPGLKEKTTDEFNDVSLTSLQTVINEDTEITSELKTVETISTNIETTTSDDKIDEIKLENILTLGEDQPNNIEEVGSVLLEQTQVNQKEELSSSKYVYREETSNHDCRKEETVIHQEDSVTSEAGLKSQGIPSELNIQADNIEEAYIDTTVQTQGSKLNEEIIIDDSINIDGSSTSSTDNMTVTTTTTTLDAGTGSIAMTDEDVTVASQLNTYSESKSCKTNCKTISQNEASSEESQPDNIEEKVVSSEEVQSISIVEETCCNTDEAVLQSKNFISSTDKNTSACDHLSVSSKGSSVGNVNLQISTDSKKDDSQNEHTKNIEVEEVDAGQDQVRKSSNNDYLAIERTLVNIEGSQQTGDESQRGMRELSTISELSESSNHIVSKHEETIALKSKSSKKDEYKQCEVTPCSQEVEIDIQSIKCLLPDVPSSEREIVELSQSTQIDMSEITFKTDNENVMTKTPECNMSPKVAHTDDSIPSSLDEKLKLNPIETNTMNSGMEEDKSSVCRMQETNPESTESAESKLEKKPYENQISSVDMTISTSDSEVFKVISNENIDNADINVESLVIPDTNSDLVTVSKKSLRNTEVVEMSQHRESCDNPNQNSVESETIQNKSEITSTVELSSECSIPKSSNLKILADDSDCKTDCTPTLQSSTLLENLNAFASVHHDSESNIFNAESENNSKITIALLGHKEEESNVSCSISQDLIEENVMTQGTMDCKADVSLEHKEEKSNVSVSVSKNLIEGNIVDQETLSIIDTDIIKSTVNCEEDISLKHEEEKSSVTCYASKSSIEETIMAQETSDITDTGIINSSLNCEAELSLEHKEEKSTMSCSTISKGMIEGNVVDQESLDFMDTGVENSSTNCEAELSSEHKEEKSSVSCLTSKGTIDETIMAKGALDVIDTGIINSSMNCKAELSLEHKEEKSTMSCSTSSKGIIGGNVVDQDGLDIMDTGVINSSMNCEELSSEHKEEKSSVSCSTSEGEIESNVMNQGTSDIIDTAIINSSINGEAEVQKSVDVSSLINSSTIHHNEQITSSSDCHNLQNSILEAEILKTSGKAKEVISDNFSYDNPSIACTSEKEEVGEKEVNSLKEAIIMNNRSVDNESTIIKEDITISQDQQEIIVVNDEVVQGQLAETDTNLETSYESQLTDEHILQLKENHLGSTIEYDVIRDNKSSDIECDDKDIINSKDNHTRDREKSLNEVEVLKDKTFVTALQSAQDKLETSSNVQTINHSELVEDVSTVASAESNLNGILSDHNIPINNDEDKLQTSKMNHIMEESKDHVLMISEETKQSNIVETNVDVKQETTLNAVSSIPNDCSSISTRSIEMDTSSMTATNNIVKETVVENGRSTNELQDVIKLDNGTTEEVAIVDIEGGTDETLNSKLDVGTGLKKVVCARKIASDETHYEEISESNLDVKQPISAPTVATGNIEVQVDNDDKKTMIESPDIATSNKDTLTTEEETSSTANSIACTVNSLSNDECADGGDEISLKKVSSVEEIVDKNIIKEETILNTSSVLRDSSYQILDTEGETTVSVPDEKITVDENQSRIESKVDVSELDVPMTNKNTEFHQTREISSSSLQVDQHENTDTIADSMDSIITKEDTMKMTKDMKDDSPDTPFYSMLWFPNQKWKSKTPPIVPSSSTDSNYGWFGWLVPGMHPLPQQVNSVTAEEKTSSTSDKKTSELILQSGEQFCTESDAEQSYSSHTTSVNSETTTSQSSFTSTNSVTDVQVPTIQNPNENTANECVDDNLAKFSICNNELYHENEKQIAATNGDTLMKEPTLLKKWYNSLSKPK